MKKTSLMKNSLVLTGFSLAMRIAGIAFSMYVAAGVGAEGMGLYQLTYSAFTLAVTMATAGISVAVTRVLTEEQGLRRRGSERPVMRCALGYAALVSLTAAACVLLGSEYIGGVLLSDARTALSLRVLAPALPMMSLSSCFKGHLLAVRRPIQIAVSDAIEQVVEVACPADESFTDSSAYDSHISVINEIHELLISDLSRRYTIEELSSMFHINQTTLKAAFKTVFGKSIAAYMKEYRIKRAMEFLTATDMSVSEISSMVGYENQSKFTQAFKSVTGILPKDYRKKE